MPPVPAVRLAARLAARLAVLSAVLAPGVAAQSLVIVGGGARPATVVAEIVALGGGPAGRLVVFPQASGDPAGVGAAQAAEFAVAGFGAAAAALGHPDADSTVALLDRATAVFFSGGDQSRLVAHLAGTRALAAVRRLHARGGVVAGTSAGAAVMSRVMLTGEETVNPDADGAPFSTVEPGNVATAEGFGFVTWAVVDQHFVVRRRQNRLLSAVLDRPELLGIGVDEETAVVVAADGSLRVVGNRGVQIVDARRASVEARGRGYAATDIRLHLLTSGDVLTPGRTVVSLAAPRPAPRPVTSPD